MTDLSKIFGGPFKVATKAVEPPEIQLREAIKKEGLTPPEVIKIDGEIQRFDSDEKGDKAGWYVAYPDGVPSGSFGCWRAGAKWNWRADIGRELTPEELRESRAAIERAKQVREQELKRRHEETRGEVTAIWEQGLEANDDHDYLKRKKIKAHGTRVNQDGRLMVPIYNQASQLSSIQYISPGGEKQYHPGGKVGGCYHTLGMPSDIIYIAEGFATAATIREFTDSMVVVAFSANGLPTVTGIIRETFGAGQRIVIVADNDVGGVGLAKANQAASRHGAHIAIPPEPGDANDYHNAGNDLSEILTIKASDYLVRAIDYAQQPAPLAWLVKSWVQENALMMVHGPSGSGKTFIVLDWCLRIASKLKDWRGHKVKDGSVVYLAGEGHHGIKGRIAAWLHHHKIDDLDMWLSRAGCDLNTEAGYHQVSESLRELPTKPKLIVVDTLHRFLLGDENSAQDAKTMLDACANLMESFDCSVLLVHHTGVSDDAQHRARGSSAWRGALDIEVSVVPAKGDKPIEIVQRKSKDAELAMSHQCELQQVVIPGWFDEDGEPVHSAIVGEANYTPVNEKLAIRKDRFARAWQDNDCPLDPDRRPWLSSRQLREWLINTEGLKPSTAESEVKASKTGRLLNVLIEENLIESRSVGWSVCDEEWAGFLNISRLSRP
jgi:phage/plasmid primase-like uncharacterized protein